MPTAKLSGLALAAISLAVGVATLRSQEMLKNETQFKGPAIPYSNPGSGKQMYKDYCASCHGRSGRGDGAAAAFLKTWPPDLTALALRNNGKYPEIKVRETLLFGTGNRADGASAMPVWGSLFRAENQNDRELKQRVTNLTRFVETLQHE